MSYKRLGKYLSKEELQEFFDGVKRATEHDTEAENTTLDVQHLKFNPEYELSIEDIKIGKLIETS